MNKTADPALSSALLPGGLELGHRLFSASRLSCHGSPACQLAWPISGLEIVEAEPLLSISFSTWTHPLVSVSLENLTSTDAVPCRDKRAARGEETDNTPHCSPWTHTPVLTGSDLPSIRVLGCLSSAHYAQGLCHPG